jgi:hypothetical protein
MARPRTHTATVVDSKIRSIRYKVTPQKLQIKTHGQKGFWIAWHKINDWIDELWDANDYRKLHKSKVIDGIYAYGPSGISLGELFYVNYSDVMTFTDELWEIGDVYGKTA